MRDRRLRHPHSIRISISGIPMPVSYTHLDVYKRQPLEKIIIEMDILTGKCSDRFMAHVLKRREHMPTTGYSHATASPASRSIPQWPTKPHVSTKRKEKKTTGTGISI